MIREIEVKCVQPIMACLVQRCCTGLVLKGLKKPAKNSLRMVFFRAKDGKPDLPNTKQ